MIWISDRGFQAIFGALIPWNSACPEPEARRLQGHAHVLQQRLSPKSQPDPLIEILGVMLLSERKIQGQSDF